MVQSGMAIRAVITLYGWTSISVCHKYRTGTRSWTSFRVYFTAPNMRTQFKAMYMAATLDLTSHTNSTLVVLVLAKCVKRRSVVIPRCAFNICVAHVHLTALTSFFYVLLALPFPEGILQRWFSDNPGLVNQEVVEKHPFSKLNKCQWSLHLSGLQLI